MTLLEPMAISPIYDFKWPVFIARSLDAGRAVLSHGFTGACDSAPLWCIFEWTNMARTPHHPAKLCGLDRFGDSFMQLQPLCYPSRQRERDFPSRRHSPFSTALRLVPNGSEKLHLRAGRAANSRPGNEEIFSFLTKANRSRKWKIFTLTLPDQMVVTRSQGGHCSTRTKRPCDRLVVNQWAITRQECFGIGPKLLYLHINSKIG
jgi:hypothetical protein